MVAPQVNYCILQTIGSRRKFWSTARPMSFFDRLKLALSILFGGQPPAAPALPPPAAAPTHGSALFLLSLLQREGRLLDFLKEDVSAFTDADVGAAARLVHEGCRKVLSQYVPIAPIEARAEGAAMDITAGFDANRLRLVGNVTGPGPWKGSLKHHGWVATSVTLPAVPTTVDLTVLAPAEVELP
jgi:Domain of unknown function (DUF2760)